MNTCQPFPLEQFPRPQCGAPEREAWVLREEHPSGETVPSRRQARLARPSVRASGEAVDRLGCVAGCPDKRGKHMAVSVGPAAVGSSALQKHAGAALDFPGDLQELLF